MIEATPLAGSGTQASGVMAPAPGADVVFKIARKPAVPVRFVAYAE